MKMSTYTVILLFSLAANTVQASDVLKKSMRIPPNSTIISKSKQSKKPATQRQEALNKRFNDYLVAEQTLKKALQDHNDRIRFCAFKTYSVTDQRAAGCQPNDTVQTCNTKLYNWCMTDVTNKIIREKRNLGTKGFRLINDVQKRAADMGVSLSGRR